MEQTNKHEETLEECIKSIAISLLKIFVSLFKTSIKYWYIIAACLIMGAIVFFLTKTSKQKNAEFIAKTFEVQAMRIADEINALNSNGKDAIIKDLGLDNSTAEALTGISAYPVVDYNNDGCSDKVLYNGINGTENVQKYYVCIRITGDESCDFENIKNAVIKRYNEDKKIRATSDYNYQTQMKELNGYKEELKKVDSLRFLYAQNNIFTKDSLSIENLSIKDVRDLIETCASIEFALGEQREPIAAYTSIRITSDDPLKHFLKIMLIAFICGIGIAAGIGNKEKIKNLVKD